MDDLISRQAAINAPVRMVSEGIEWIPVYHVEQLPSAQPEKRTEERTETRGVCLDAISRQDDFEKQIHAMFDHIWVCEIDHPVFQDTVGDLMGAVIQCHKRLPSAQPERIKGRWTKAYDGYDGHVKCVQCFKTYDWDTQAQYYNFCPNCGADMRSEIDQ